MLDDAAEDFESIFIPNILNQYLDIDTHQYQGAFFQFVLTGKRSVESLARHALIAIKYRLANYRKAKHIFIGVDAGIHDLRWSFYDAIIPILTDNFSNKFSLCGHYRYYHGIEYERELTISCLAVYE